MTVGGHWHSECRMVDCTMAEAVDERYDAHDGDGYAHSHPGCITLEQCHTQAGCEGAVYPGANRR